MTTRACFNRRQCRNTKRLQGLTATAGDDIRRAATAGVTGSCVVGKMDLVEIVTTKYGIW